jgi:hypothetical protein
VVAGCGGDDLKNGCGVACRASPPHAASPVAKSEVRLYLTDANAPLKNTILYKQLKFHHIYISRKKLVMHSLDQL